MKIKYKILSVVFLLLILSIAIVVESKCDVLDNFVNVFVRDPDNNNALKVGDDGEIFTVIQDPDNASNFANVESNGGLAVNIQDQTSRPLDLFFVKPIGNFSTLAQGTSINDTSINVTVVTGGCGVGDFIGVFGDTFYFAEILVVTGTILDLDTPLDFNFSAGDFVACTTRELNVDGDPIPQVFFVSGTTTQNFSIDITRIMIEMTCTDTPDFSEFCDIGGGLTKGIVLRKRDDENWNIFNAKSNAELANLMFDLNVLEETLPFNVNGIVGRYTFAGASKHGVALRLRKGDRLELWIQDDLTSILSFRIIAEGHIVTD